MDTSQIKTFLFFSPTQKKNLRDERATTKKLSKKKYASSTSKHVRTHKVSFWSCFCLTGCYNIFFLSAVSRKMRSPKTKTFFIKRQNMKSVEFFFHPQNRWFYWAFGMGNDFTNRFFIFNLYQAEPTLLYRQHNDESISHRLCLFILPDICWDRAKVYMSDAWGHIAHRWTKYLFEVNSIRFLDLKKSFSYKLYERNTLIACNASKFIRRFSLMESTNNVRQQQHWHHNNNHSINSRIEATTTTTAVLKLISLAVTIKETHK